MDFASISALGKEIFRTDDSGLNWLYSASLIAVVFSSIPAIYLMESHGPTGNWSVMAIGTLSNVGGGWLRWLSVAQESYALALLSSVVLGVAGAAVIVSIVPLAEHNFPKDQRTLATTIAVQMNYLGWCLSSVVVPLNSSTESELGSMLFAQAIFISMSLVLFALFHRPLPLWCGAGKSRAAATEKNEYDALIGSNTSVDDASPPTSSSHGGLSHHARQMGALFYNRQFMVQCVCFSALGGISFALPAVQDELFLEVGLPQVLTKWTNLAFLATGVVSGLVIGGVFHKYQIQPFHFTSLLTIRVLFCTCTVSLSGLAVLASVSSSLSNGTVFALALVLMAVSGGCSLGFVGIALPQVVSVARPVSEVYSASLVEWLLQIWGVVFAQWCASSGGSGGSGGNATAPSSVASALSGGRDSTHSNGFVICAVSCGVATVGLLFCSGRKMSLVWWKSESVGEE